MPRWNGGVIGAANNPSAISAKGVWSLAEVTKAIRAGNWPVPTGNGDPYFQYNSILLPGQGTNGAQNNTFLDSSTNNFTITRNGNTTQGTFTPFSHSDGYWGNYFDGSGDYLTAPSNSAYDVGSGAFSVECWFYASSVSSQQQLFSWSVAFTGLELEISASGQIGISLGNGSSWVLAAQAAGVVSANIWNHVAWVRSSGTMSVFINGIRTYTVSNSTTVGNANTLLSIGSNRGTTTNPLGGYISNFRYVKGSAVYDPTQTTLTVPTSPLTAITNTSLLTCQSNRFIDNSANAFTITRAGDVSVQTFQPFGTPTSAYSSATNGGSGYFDGTGDYLTAPSNVAFNIGTGDFTIEGWVYLPSAGSAGYGLVSINGYELFVRSSANGTTACWYNGSSVVAESASAVTSNAWNHIAVSRTGTTLRVYLNGVSGTSATNSNSVGGTATCYVGVYSNGSSDIFYGYLSDVRIVKGTAVYTGATLTVPTAPLTAISGTSLLLSCTNAGIIDNAEKNDLETVGNAQISTSQYKWGTSSMYFDGTGDYLLAPVSNLYDFGTGDFTIEMWLYPNTVSSTQVIYDQWTNASGSYTTGQTQLQINSSAKIVFDVATGASSTTKLTTTSSISASTWTHVAIVRTAGVIKCFLNGNADATTSSVSTQVGLSTRTPAIGVELRSSSAYYNGYIADMRVTKGYARYLYNFTAPTAAFPLFYQAAATPTSDPYFENTTLLLPGNGTNGAQNNTFLDSSTNAFTITRNGNTTQGTFTPFSQTGWGNYFDGTGDYLSLSSNASLSAGSGDFTIEAWLYPTAAYSTYNSVYVGNATSGMNFGKISGGLGLRESGVGDLISATAPEINQWVHVAVTRSGTSLRLFFNGVQQGATVTNSTNFATSAVYIGDNGAGTAYWNGYISNLRFIKGTALYTSNFSIPTSPLTAVTNTQLLTCQSNRFIDNSTNAFAITVNGNTSVQAFSPFNPTASYSTSTVGGSGYFDGSSDYLSLPTSSQIIPATGDFTFEGWIYPIDVNNYYAIYSQTDGVSSSGRTQITCYQGNLSLQIGASSVATTGNPIKNNQWNYIAITRTGSSVYFYVNGAAGVSATLSGTVDTGSSVVYVGGNWSSTYFYGYIGSLRISNTIRSSLTTVPTAPYTSDGNTRLLTSYTNGGITDATAKNDLETVGGASISTTQSKFGGSSMYFDGTGDWLLGKVNGSLLDFGTGDLTVEFWAWKSGNGSNGYDAAVASQVSSTSQSWFFEISSSRGFLFGARIGGTNYSVANNTTTGINDSTWHHWAVVRYSGTWYIYKDGVALTKTTDTIGSQSITGGTLCYVGNWNDGANYPFNGYINDLRVTKGIARYTTNFTPPTTAFLTL